MSSSKTTWQGGWQRNRSDADVNVFISVSQRRGGSLGGVGSAMMGVGGSSDDG
jgi:hypothetical protein